MKKITIVSLASFFFLFLCSAVAILLRGALTDPILALVLGVLILALSGVVAFIVRERTWVNVLCFFLSSVAMGVLIRAWYINRGFDNSFGTMLLVSLCAVLYLWVFFALSRIPFLRKSKVAFIIFFVGYAILSTVLYCIVVATTETTYVSTFGYYMIIELAFILAMSLEVNSGAELVRNLTLSTYSVLVVAVIAAVFILIAALGDGDCDCDCDCCDGCSCDGCDCGGSDGSKKSKKSKKSP